MSGLSGSNDPASDGRLGPSKNLGSTEAPPNPPAGMPSGAGGEDDPAASAIKRLIEENPAIADKKLAMGLARFVLGSRIPSNLREVALRNNANIGLETFLGDPDRVLEILNQYNPVRRFRKTIDKPDDVRLSNGLTELRYGYHGSGPTRKLQAVSLKYEEGDERIYFLLLGLKKGTVHFQRFTRFANVKEHPLAPDHGLAAEIPPTLLMKSPYRSSLQEKLINQYAVLNFGNWFEGNQLKIQRIEAYRFHEAEKMAPFLRPRDAMGFYSRDDAVTLKSVSFPKTTLSFSLDDEGNLEYSRELVNRGPDDRTSLHYNALSDELVYSDYLIQHWSGEADQAAPQ